MLAITTLEQFHVKSNETHVILRTFTSNNIVMFNETKLKLLINYHQKDKKKDYQFSYYELQKWSETFNHYLPPFETLLQLFSTKQIITK